MLLTGGERPLAAGQESAANEITWKANFLAKSATFLDWPGDSPLHMANTFRWCVFGTFSFGTKLAEMTRDMVIEGKHSEVKWIRKESELTGCQIIFVTRSEAKYYAKVLDAARSARALTVGETADFLDAGGMVALFTDGKAPAFEVNLEAVEARSGRGSKRNHSFEKRTRLYTGQNRTGGTAS